MHPTPPVSSTGISGLASRRLEPELMDDPDLDPEAHRRALRALSRVHVLSGTGGRLRRILDHIASNLPDGRELRVLDLACGGGDAALDAARWGKTRGRAIRVVGLDLSEVALGVARARTESAGLEAEWIRGNALTDLPPGPFDLVTSSLFLHHLTEAEVVSLLRTTSERSSHLHIEDLRRTRIGWLLAWGTLRVVSRSHVAHVDGPQSVEAGWRRDELEKLVALAGLSGARLQTGWPQRWILSWSRR